MSCSKPEIDTSGITQSLVFVGSGPNASWFAMGAPEYQDGYKAVEVRMEPPGEEVELAEGLDQVWVRGMIEGSLASGNVDLQVEYYSLDISPLG